jgi:hypothetical protein
MRPLLVFILLVLATFCPRLAWTEPAADAESRSRQHFEAGATRYRLGDFSGAVTEFKAALEWVNRPSVLFNIAQCYRQLKVPEQAMFYYRLYLSQWERQHAGAPAPHHDEVSRFLEELIDDLERARAEKARERELQAQRAERARQAELAAPLVRPPVLPEAKKTAKAPIYKRWWFWSALGAVAVGSITAAALAGRSEGGSVPRGTLDTLEIK